MQPAPAITHPAPPRAGELSAKLTEGAQGTKTAPLTADAADERSESSGSPPPTAHSPLPTASQLNTLFTALQNPTLTIHDIADQLDLTIPEVAALIDSAGGPDPCH